MILYNAASPLKKNEISYTIKLPPDEKRKCLNFLTMNANKISD